jgi:hypothetical protein
MSIRFVTRQIHALIDCPVALSLMGTPFLLGIGATNPLARWLSVVVGLAALLLTLLTKHEAGLVRVLPYQFHVLVDRIVGITFLIAPIALGFSGMDAAYYWANAAALISANLHYSGQRFQIESGWD